jgi:lysophospholipid acyltransferase (LPLAT)-like uncharacterized protein
MTVNANRPSIVHTITGWRHLVLLPLALLIRLWGASLRFHDNTPENNPFADLQTPTVFLLWHNRLFLAIEYFRRYRGGSSIHALVSSSKDGAWLAALFDLVGMEAVRGSSSRHGREAVQDLLNILKQPAHHIGITPDGPKGPLYAVKPGALIIARRAQARVVILGAKFGPAIRLKSWDHFAIPLPFSRIEFFPALVPAEVLADKNTTAETLREKLLAANPDPVSL